jgi:hypothetical protein
MNKSGVIIFDMDETILHSFDKVSQEALVGINNQFTQHSSGLKNKSGADITEYIFKRNGIEEVIKELSPNYHICIFTASKKDQNLINQHIKDLFGNLFEGIYFLHDNSSINNLINIIRQNGNRFVLVDDNGYLAKLKIMSIYKNAIADSNNEVESYLERHWIHIPEFKPFQYAKKEGQKGGIWVLKKDEQNFMEDIVNLEDLKQNINYKIGRAELSDRLYKINNELKEKEDISKVATESIIRLIINKKQQKNHL